MSEYLFEMHSHSKEVSVCSPNTAKQIIDAYRNTEYSGIVLTNHMNPWTFLNRGLENLSWEEKVTHFLSGFSEMKKQSNGDLTILLGMEIRFYNHPNDYLVYGVTEDFLYNNGDLMALKPKTFSKLAHENNLLFLQAHPFRRDMQIEDWKILDGYEVFNGNPNHFSSNEIAESWAKFHNKSIIVSGSDVHESRYAGIGGVYFKNPIKTNEDLVAELRSGNYRLKKTDFKHARPE